LHQWHMGEPSRTCLRLRVNSGVGRLDICLPYSTYGLLLAPSQARLLSECVNSLWLVSLPPFVLCLHRSPFESM
jgi:hypothetical protein